MSPQSGGLTGHCPGTVGEGREGISRHLISRLELHYEPRIGSTRRRDSGSPHQPAQPPHGPRTGHL
jgi:hypothetical protein